ncbi:hypothetical protein H5410_053011 [Solanum commersonii]|uniref:Uncharacterized protein n=1 Tax=Solanum commersonii TaxID=4109 RepID=A0A9J5X5U5_SOLCO|nr:hypothetical protein H5410_053011 [Solanum commersonii]
MEPVDPNGQNVPFSRSNDPRSNSPSFLVICNSNVIFAKNFHGRPFKTLVMEAVGPDGKNVPFSRSNDPWSR